MRFDGVPIARVDVFQTVLRTVQEWIAQSGLQAGDRLPGERELAEQLGVSRSSLRQALKVLASLRLVEQRHGSGTYVTAPVGDPLVSMLLAELDDREDALAQVADLRAAIDALALRLAGERATADDLDRLARFLAERERELGSEPASPGSLDLQFEALLAEVAGNAYVVRFQRIVHALYLHAWAGRGRAPADVLSLHREHLRMVELMRAGAWDAAHALMWAHVTRRVEGAHGDAG